MVTFLFTDVEGSTRRWEADAEGMQAALAAHDEVLRDAIQAHGGFMFKHTGDGVCAAFSSPKSAINAAVAAQQALELPVRMGLATGEAELRDGDYFGAVLNRAARVMAAGHGGQILLAESTAGLLSGVDLLDLGPRQLRDLPTPVGVFQVQADGLRTEFPALRALDASPGNLRAATTSFIGRESEVAELQAVVKAHRLVTLTGVGGVGKTRLAVEVAARLADEFPDGVWFFELAAVTDPAAIPDAVAAVLGITQQPGKTVTESVASALEGGSRLLVFDNCEHVARRVADLVEAILAASATVTILATSREGVGSRRTVIAGPVAGCQLWNRIRCREPFRRPCPQCRFGLLAGPARRGGRCSGNLPQTRRHPVGHRVGGFADGVDDRQRGAGSSRSAVPAAGRLATRPVTAPNAASCGGVVLRPAR